MNLIDKLLKSEATSGVLIIIAMLCAMMAENSSAKTYYDIFLNTPVNIQIGNLIIAKPLLLWVNDALMAVFFFLVGLELKREFLIGELSDKRKLIQPGLAAIFGIAFPALIYVYINLGDPVALNGWAVPTATDIAFALGALSLLGDRVPKELKIMLLSIAIIDDICAIGIIGVFYSHDLSFSTLLLSLVAIGVLVILNKRRVKSFTPYFLVGVLLWVSVLKSGIHATLSGIVLAMFIPLESYDKDQGSMLERLENDLHSSVAYVILPLFAFANSGINFKGFNLSDLVEPIPLGITLGLILGKQVGVFLGIWLASKISIPLPKSVKWSHIYGLAALCGIGFTMSLFISGLAFEHGAGGMQHTVRVGILVGSIISAFIGCFILNITCKKAIKG